MIRKRKYDLLFPLDFAGTLCARDGIKTGPRPPNGEDAYDRKLIVMRIRKKRKNGKGGCGIMVNEEHTPCLATMFQPFVFSTKKK